MVYQEILAAARQALSALGVKEAEAVLGANGGPRQDVGQLHVHLFTGERYVSSPGGEIGTPIFAAEQVQAFHHPAPNWEVHLVLRSEETRQMASLISLLVKQYALELRGYTLVVQSDDLFHRVTGRRLKREAM